MKRSIISIFLIILLLGAGTFFFTPLGPKLRGYAGRIWSRNAVALKTDQQLSDNVNGWQLMDIDGNTHGFATERGKVVFLNFWATWCGPCLKEMPDIQKLYDDYGTKVSFLLVTQEDTAKVKAFLKKKHYTMPIYFTAITDIPEEIRSKSMPTTYIIGKSGKIVRAKTGATDWYHEEIRMLLDGLLEN